jgi:ubiquinone/menaquinone biosynthesis C-methylase UbiE
MPNDGVSRLFRNPHAAFLKCIQAEQDRLDFQHTALTILIGDKLGLAPVDSPEHVLDIATGTGIWAIEYGQLAFMH